MAKRLMLVAGRKTVPCMCDSHTKWNATTSQCQCDDGATTLIHYCHYMSRQTTRQHVVHLLAQLQVFLNFNVIVPVGLLLRKMTLETDNCRLSEVCQQSANSLDKSWINMSVTSSELSLCRQLAAPAVTTKFKKKNQQKDCKTYTQTNSTNLTHLKESNPS